MPLKQYDTSSADARSLPRESIGSATTRVHWEMCRKYGIECNDKWYDHQTLPTAENGEVRITWDVTIYTDKVLKHNRPDITPVHKDTQTWTLINIAAPADQNITRTEGKVEKYQELAFEIRRIHGASKVTVIPIVIVALGRPGLACQMYLASLEVYNYRPSLELLTCCGKCCVSKLRGVAEIQ